MKKLILLFLLLFVSSPVFAKNEVITVISDVHLSSDKTTNKMTPSIQNLLNTVKQTNIDSGDYVVFLGDNIKSPNRVDVAMFAKIINKLKKPVYVVLGNRDTGKSDNLNQKEYFRILNKFSKNKTTSLPSYAKAGDLIFIFMYGVNEAIPTYRGNYRASELRFLDKTLTRFKDKKAIIFQHFPVVAPKEDRDRNPYHPELYLKELSKHDNVLAVVSGHYHFENIIEQDGIKHISVGSLGLNREYEQLKIFKNQDGTYSITVKILEVE